MFKGEPASFIAFAGGRSWQSAAEEDEFVVYLGPPSIRSHSQSSLTETETSNGLVVLGPPSDETVADQVDIATALVSGTPLDLAVLGTVSGRVAALDWASSTGHPDAMDIFQQVASAAATHLERDATARASWLVLTTANERADALAPLLQQTEGYFDALGLLQAIADPTSTEAPVIFAEALERPAPVRAAALRHLHQVQTTPDLEWSLTQLLAFERDSAVRAALVHHLAIIGDDVALRQLYPAVLPEAPAVRRNYLLGQARSGTSEGWLEIQVHGTDSDPVTRTMVYEAAAVLARSGGSMAIAASDWLNNLPLDAHFVAQLAQANAVGLTPRTNERRQWLTNVAGAASSPLDLAYSAAFHLMSECSTAVTPYAATIVASTPHASVEQAINTTLAAWSANGGPTCD